MNTWLGAAVALAIGLLIGIERERSKGDGPDRRAAGIRTFALASLAGAIAFQIGGVLLLAVALAGTGVLAALAYVRSSDDDPGLTTEVALLCTLLLGATAAVDPALAAGLGALVAAILAAKARLHGFVKGALTDAEVKDGLIFAIATLVIWPLLPDRPLGPFEAINPRSVWLLVVLVLAIGAAGYAATRILGPRHGLPLAGFAAGFVSSTATIGSMANRTGRDSRITGPAVAGAALSTVATFVQMAALLLTADVATLQTMAPILVTSAVVAALYAFAFMVRGGGPPMPEAFDSGRAFSLVTALGLAAMMAVMLVASAAMKTWLGETGLIAAATLAGLVDTHAAAISVAALVASGELTPREAVIPILGAMTSNALAKIAMAITAGNRAFVVRIVPGIVLSMLAAWIAAALVVLV